MAKEAEEAKRPKAPAVEAKRCFVISPLGDPGSETRQKADDFLQYIVQQCSAIGEHGYKLLRADKMSEPGRITSQIVRAIVEADLVIADVTGANPNVYYEMALRHAVGKPIIVCAEATTTLPFDTRDNRTIFYTLHARVAAQAREELAAQIRTINKDGFRPDNPIADAQGIIELARTGHGETAVVLERLTEISSRLSNLENDQRAAKLLTEGREFVLRPFTSADLSPAVTISSGIVSERQAVTSGPRSAGIIVTAPFRPAIGEETTRAAPGANADAPKR